MMDLATIQSLADEQAKRAKRARLEPLVPFSAEEVRERRQMTHVPNIGSYVPRGWKEIDRWFIDKYGEGGGGGDLSFDELNAKVIENIEAGKYYGYAIVEEGEFQLYIGVFQHAGR